MGEHSLNIAYHDRNQVRRRQPHAAIADGFSGLLARSPRGARRLQLHQRPDVAVFGLSGAAVVLFDRLLYLRLPGGGAVREMDHRSPLDDSGLRLLESDVGRLWARSWSGGTSQIMIRWFDGARFRGYVHSHWYVHFLRCTDSYDLLLNCVYPEGTSTQGERSLRHCSLW